MSKLLLGTWVSGGTLLKSEVQGHFLEKKVYNSVGEHKCLIRKLKSI